MYDVNGKARLVDADDLFQCPELQSLEAKTHGKSFEKLCRTFDGAVDDELTTAQNRCRIAFQKTGKVVGFTSQVPAEKVNHAWNVIQQATGGGRLASKTMGLFMRWRMALRTEDHWLTDKQDTGRVDELDGTPIYSARYWLAPNFTPPSAFSGAKRTVVAALTRAYGEYSDGGAMADAFRRAVRT